MTSDRRNIAAHQFSMDDLTAAIGNPVYGSDGEKIGDVEQIFYDTHTGQPEWIGIETGFLGMKTVVAPVPGAQLQMGDRPSLVVPYSKDWVKDTPNIPSDVIDEATERSLYAHYGLEPSSHFNEDFPQDDTVTGTDFGRESVNIGGGEVSMTRHEEQLEVGKRDQVRGRVRLRKWVETQPASEQVELRRETAQVEREQVNRAAPGAQMGEQEVEMTLHEERPVVAKETVEVERVTLRPEEERHQETVQEEVRKEHIEVEGDPNLEERYP